MTTIGYIPRPRTASKTCPDVSRAWTTPLAAHLSHDKEFFGGQEGIRMEVRDVSALIEMLILAKQEAHKRGREDAARRHKLGHA